MVQWQPQTQPGLKLRFKFTRAHSLAASPPSEETAAELLVQYHVDKIRTFKFATDCSGHACFSDMPAFPTAAGLCQCRDCDGGRCPSSGWA